MDNVEDLAAEKLRDEGARATGADVTEDGGTLVSDGDIFPFQTGYGGVIGCNFRAVILGCCYLVVVDPEVDKVYLHS